jgi:hypothetical protein
MHQHDSKLFAANFTKWLLLCAAAGFGSLFAYNVLSPIHPILGLVAAVVVVGFNFAEGFLIRFAIAGWRFDFNRLALLSFIGVLLVAVYSLMAGSSVIETMLAKNQELQVSAELQIRAAKTRIESAKADTLRVQMEARQADKYGYLTSSAVVGAQANELKIQAQEQEKMAAIMKNKSAAFTSPLFDASGVAFIMSLALEASIIGLSAFIELFLMPTPLPALIKFNDKLIDWGINNSQVQNLNIEASPAYGTISSPTGTVGLPNSTSRTLPQTIRMVVMGEERGQSRGGDFEAAYQEWLKLIVTRKLKPTVAPNKKHIKTLLNVSYDDAQDIAVDWLDRAYNQGILDDNPNYKEGLAKYILARPRLLGNGDQHE